MTIEIVVLESLRLPTSLFCLSKEQLILQYRRKVLSLIKRSVDIIFEDKGYFYLENRGLGILMLMKIEEYLKRCNDFEGKMKSEIILRV